MTEAHEVHLFSWMKENLAWLGAIAIVMWAMALFWYRTVVNKFYSKEVCEERLDTKISKCKLAVDDDVKSILAEVRHLSTKLDRQDDRRREDANENAKQHGDIRHDLTMLAKADK